MKAVKTLDKYISKQLLEVFLMGIVIFTSIVFASDTFTSLIKQISMYGIPFNIAILIVVLKLPSILVLSIPMGVLFSIVMTINKLSLNSEITVMRSCAIGLSRIAKPAFAFAISGMFVCFFINEFIAPFANAQAKKTYNLGNTTAKCPRRQGQLHHKANRRPQRPQKTALC